MEEHLQTCRQCRELTKYFERMILFDLPAIAVVRTRDAVPEYSTSVDENEILAGIHEKVAANSHRKLAEPQQEPTPAFSCRMQFWKRFLPLRLHPVASLGWTLAAILLVLYAQARLGTVEYATVTQPISVETFPTVDLGALQERAQSAESQLSKFMSSLSGIELQARSAQLAYSRLNPSIRTFVVTTLPWKSSSREHKESCPNRALNCRSRAIA
jgi:hypothetical protein